MAAASLDLDGLGHGLADVTHGGAGLGGLEGGVGAVGPGDGQFAVVVWDVGVGSWFGCGVDATGQFVLLLFLLLLKPGHRGVETGTQRG